MSNTEVDIWNMALSSAQEKASIVSPTENSKLAHICRLWYPTARRRSLKAGAWPCATSYARLALISERDGALPWANTDPAPGFKYAYGLPTDLLAPQYLHTWERFEQIYSNGRRTLVTNTADALLRYTFDQETVAEWDEGLVLTVASFLGALICRNLNGKLGLSDRLTQEARDTASEAQTEIANHEHVDYATLPPNVVARGYGGPPSQVRYYQPFDQLNGVAE